MNEYIKKNWYGVVLVCTLIISFTVGFVSNAVRDDSRTKKFAPVYAQCFQKYDNSTFLGNPMIKSFDVCLSIKHDKNDCMEELLYTYCPEMTGDF